MAYATTADLEAWLAPDPAPVNAVRLLEQASDDIDELLTGAVYDPDNAGVLAVLTKACVRQVHWLMERDDETGANADVQSMTVGQRSVTRRSGAGSGSSDSVPRIGPRTAQVLRNAGLLTMWPLVVG